MASFIRATLCAFLFLALASSTFATPSPVNLATTTNTDSIAERSTLVSGVESILQSDDLEKRGRRHKHRKPKRKSHRKKSSRNSAAASSKSAKGVRHSGDATYYTVGMGACGYQNSDNEMIAAASHALYDSFPGATANPNHNPICGRRLKATYKGRSVIVKIVDRCEGCAEWALDFSPKAFNHMGKPADGRLHGMQWEWI